MASVDVLTPAGETAGTVELPDDIFDVQVNVPLIHQVVVGQLAAARQGTRSAKTRAEVRGGGKKPYRQKGTGRARQGSTRAPQFTGGGVVHGPTPRDYTPADAQEDEGGCPARRPLRPGPRRPGARRDLARRRLQAPRPRRRRRSLAPPVRASARARGARARPTRSAWKSLRNLEQVHLLVPDQLNTYDVLVSDDVVFTQGALEAFLAGPTKGKGAKATASDVRAPRR